MGRNNCGICGSHKQSKIYFLSPHSCFVSKDYILKFKKKYYLKYLCENCYKKAEEERNGPPLTKEEIKCERAVSSLCHAGSLGFNFP